MIAAAEVEADLHGTPWSREVAAQRVVSIRVDSLAVIGILCEVKPTLEFELPESVVRAGGHRAVNETIGYLMLRIEQECASGKEAVMNGALEKEGHEDAERRQLGARLRETRKYLGLK